MVNRTFGAVFGFVSILALCLCCGEVDGVQANAMDPVELHAKLKGMDLLYTSGLTLAGTDVRVPMYPDVPRQRIRWRMTLHEDEFALEQIPDKIFECQPLPPNSGVFGKPSMMMKCVVYVGKERAGQHMIHGKISEPGVPPKLEDNMLGGSVLIHPSRRDYFILAKNRYPWSIGRCYSQYIDRITQVAEDESGVLSVKAWGRGLGQSQGLWDLKINPAAMYMVQDATFTLGSTGELRKKPELVLHNSGIRWYGGICIPAKTTWKGIVGQDAEVPISFDFASSSADVAFLKQAKRFLDPPYRVETTHSIVGRANSDRTYKPGEVD